MIQSFDVQLQVALRALGEVVAPALQGAEKHVAEQLHLAMATLSFIRTRLPEARRYYRMELLFYMELATAAAELAQPCLPAESEDLVQIVSSGEAMLDDPEFKKDASMIEPDFDPINGKAVQEIVSAARIGSAETLEIVKRIVNAE